MDKRASISLILFVFAALACGPTCPSGQVRCDNTCVDLTTDVDHCGSCAKLCPGGATCAASACACPSGEVTCGGDCVDTSTDTANCGACGHDCGLGTCNNGVCVCAASPATVMDCGGSPECVDTASDTGNCGACHTACALENEQCSGGMCECLAPRATSCPVASPTACVNLQNDVANCGTCGADCLSGGECDGGVCGCAAPLVGCPTTQPTACVNEESDSNNCGACGIACAIGQTCQSGLCCAKTVCGGACVDTTDNPANCGTCGNACPSAAPTCISGACCGPGTTAVCGGACCGGGTTCCASGACQQQHYNGLGGPQGSTFFDCNAADSLAAAADAALAWSPSGKQPATESTFTGVDCEAWTTSDGTQCAVFCATGSAAPGLVKLTLNSLGCVAPFVGDPTSSPWQ